MTIQEALVYSREQLKTIYDQGEADAISDWLIEHVAALKKTERVSQLKKIMPEDQLVTLNTYLDRLLEHEPIQYILNEAWFCGLKFYVDKNVLIPRPETEELVEWIITNCKFPVDKLSILDVGTGSGCIAIALKRRLGKADVWACDISEDALKVAQTNATTLGVDVKFQQLDFLSQQARQTLPSFDIIVSNPPYIPQKDRYSIKANVLEYEPAKALFVPDNDPLIFYRAITAFGKEHLHEDGSIFIEINENLGQLTVKLFNENGYQAEIKKDLQGKERMIWGSKIETG